MPWLDLAHYLPLLNGTEKISGTLQSVSTAPRNFYCVVLSFWRMIQHMFFCWFFIRGPLVPLLDFCQFCHDVLADHALILISLGVVNFYLIAFLLICFDCHKILRISHRIGGLWMDCVGKSILVSECIQLTGVLLGILVELSTILRIFGSKVLQRWSSFSPT